MFLATRNLLLCRVTLPWVEKVRTEGIDGREVGVNNNLFGIICVKLGHIFWHGDVLFNVGVL